MPPGREVLVDPFFRDQFELAAATPSYGAFLAASVPGVFVGDRARLEATVRSVAAAIRHTHGVQGISLPPWRTLGALLSKWAPCNFRDSYISARMVQDAVPEMRRLSCQLARAPSKCCTSGGFAHLRQGRGAKPHGSAGAAA